MTEAINIDFAGHNVKVDTINGMLRIVLNQRAAECGDGITVIDVGTDPTKLLISTDRIIRTDADIERMI